LRSRQPLPGELQYLKERAKKIVRRWNIYVRGANNDEIVEFSRYYANSVRLARLYGNFEGPIERMPEKDEVAAALVRDAMAHPHPFVPSVITHLIVACVLYQPAHTLLQHEDYVYFLEAARLGRHEV
jgi:hypothetical protein